MAFPKYQDYKDSGVDWLREVPAHWQIIPLKRFLSVSSGDFLPSQNQTSEGYSVYGGNGLRGFANTFNNSGRMLLIGRVGAKCGNVHLVDGKYWVSEHALRVLPRKQFCLDFFKYLLEAIDFNRFAIRTAQPLINSEIVLMQKVAIPSYEEQKIIADFLDRKISEIDQAIAQKQRFIELLQEQKAILINQAITKGLNPNTPMRDSCFEWIGEIPKHWDIKKLKYICPYITVGIVITPSKYYVESGVPCLRSLNIKPGEIIEKEPVYISEKSNNYLSKSQIFDGDIVCVRTGQPGTTAVVDKRFNGANCIDLIIIRKSREISSEYLSLAMNSEMCRSQYLIGASGAIQQHFNIEMAKNLVVCLPPLGEQKAIIEHISRLEIMMREMVAAIQREIDSLIEFKQVVIASFVTGKIKA